MGALASELEPSQLREQPGFWFFVCPLLSCGFKEVGWPRNVQNSHRGRLAKSTPRFQRRFLVLSVPWRSDPHRSAFSSRYPWKFLCSHALASWLRARASGAARNISSQGREAARTLRFFARPCSWILELNASHRWLHLRHSRPSPTLLSCVSSLCALLPSHSCAVALCLSRSSECLPPLPVCFRSPAFSLCNFLRICSCWSFFRYYIAMN